MRGAYQRWFYNGLEQGNEGGAMPVVKTFKFRYNDDVATEEEENDLGGTIPIPRIGDLLFRKGKTWDGQGLAL